MTRDELRAWRKAAGMTQAELAHALGVGREAVNRWEVGTRSIPPLLPHALAGIANQPVGV